MQELKTVNNKGKAYRTENFFVIISESYDSWMASDSAEQDRLIQAVLTGNTEKIEHSSVKEFHCEFNTPDQVTFTWIALDTKQEATFVKADFMKLYYAGLT